mmetsp:Transcript_15447/g.43219  ORF Transcript_15447/g.43219 Transcript_15447/m.43219 type:complete len:328 (+) Transcript_15447:130-1113(+)|eukprot:CAMPEP_0117665950 /NCGR_PEP_ID=MMETSP0804-20121206/10097_1 /TAXON_ID=1074897 /ORGANISM="Tetraselmis astigmatica, Strain CCMP880" /LENGTH=327 /DNA_ID=CAMNT_0005473425 /DNA_START=53 /DNA_END=1036 /DNA_ORIENTATION=-
MLNATHLCSAATTAALICRPLWASRHRPPSSSWCRPGPLRARPLTSPRFRHHLQAREGSKFRPVAALPIDAEGLKKALLGAVADPTTADAATAKSACESLMALPGGRGAATQGRSGGADATLEGVWQVRWSTMAGTRPPPKPSKAAPGFQPSLSMLSFGALAKVPVEIAGAYNRVRLGGGDQDGNGDAEGIYELINVLKILPEALVEEGEDTISEEAVTLAMALAGPCREAEGAPGEWEVTFTSVTLCPPIGSLDAEERAALGAKLGAPLGTPVDLGSQSGSIDVGFIDGSLRVHRGKSGAIYVLDRLSSSVGPEDSALIPFELPEQ